MRWPRRPASVPPCRCGSISAPACAPRPRPIGGLSRPRAVLEDAKQPGPSPDGAPDGRSFPLAATGVVLHQALFLTCPVLVALGVALVVQFLAASQTEVQLDAPTLVVQVQ